MKRNPVKAAGLGLALCAGFLQGQDPQPPAMLPSAVRGAPWPAAQASHSSDTVWLPAKGHSAPQSVIPAGHPPLIVVPDVVKPKPLPVVELPAPKVPTIPVVEIPNPKAPAIPVVEIPAPKASSILLPELPFTPAPFPVAPTLPPPTMTTDLPISAPSCSRRSIRC